MSNSKTITKKLEDVVDFVKGKPLSSKNAKKGEYGVVAGGTKITVYDNEYNAEDCITVSASGTAGHIMYHKGKKVFLTDCFSVSPKNEKELSKDFLYYFLIKNQKRMYSLASGGGVPHFYPKDMADFEIEIPEDIEEQKRIAKIMTGVDESIEVVEDEIVHYKNLLNAVIKDIKGTSLKISEVVDIKGGRLETQMAKEHGKYPFYVCSESPLKIDFADYNQEAVLIAGTGAVYCFYVNGMFNARQKVHILSKRKNIDKDFSLKSLYYIINNNLDYFRSLQAGGALKNVDQEGVLSFSFILPENEGVFLATCENIDNLINLKYKELNSLKNIKTGLLSDLT